MKKQLLFLFFLILFINCLGQDTLPKIDKSFYVRLNPISISSEAGIINDRLIQNIEIGKSFGPLDLGFAYGKYSNKRIDSSSFAQIRLTFDAAQIGIFSNEFSLGVGKVFNASTPLLFEVSSTLLVQVASKIGIGAIFGSYELSGEIAQFSKSFYGIFLRYGLLRTDNGGLISKLTRTKISKRRITKKIKSRV